METRAARDSGRSVLRAVDVLEFVAGRATGRAPGVVDISRGLGREKSVISRNLKVLTDAGLLSRDPETLGYRIGSRLFTIAVTAQDPVLAQQAADVVGGLSAQLRERMDVLVRDGGRAVTVATSAPDTPLQAIGRVGNGYPLLGTAAGRALLLDADEAEVTELYSAQPRQGEGPNAPVDAAQVWRRLEEDRSRGWAVAHEETDRSLSAVAAPVRGPGGRIVAALSAAGPTDRITDNARIVPAVLLGAQRLSTALGHVPSREEAT